LNQHDCSLGSRKLRDSKLKLLSIENYEWKRFSRTLIYFCWQTVLNLKVIKNIVLYLFTFFKLMVLKLAISGFLFYC
jgi:hypothetical protein